MSKQRQQSADRVTANSESRSMVPVQALVAPAGWEGRWIVPPGTSPDQWPTTLPDGPAAMAARVNAANAADLRLGPDGTITVVVRDLVAHPVEAVDPDTGEVHQYSRLVIISADGQTFATTGKVVAHRIAQALDLVNRGHLPWPLTVHIRERKSKLGRTYHELSIVVPREGV